LKVRTYAEASLYISEHPCQRCATRTSMDALKERRTVDSSIAHYVYRGRCTRCNNELRYEFDAPRTWPELQTFSYGGNEPSAVFTGAQWLAMAERNVAETPDDPSELAPDLYFASLAKINAAIAMVAEARKVDAAAVAILDAHLNVLRARHGRYAALKQQMNAGYSATHAPPAPRTVALSREALAAHRAWLDRGRTGAGRLELANDGVGGLPLGNLEVSYARLVRVNLTKSTVDFAKLVGAELIECTAEETNFAHSKFDEATLTDCELAGAKLVLTDFKSTRIEGGDFRRIDADRGLWIGARLLRTDFRDARFGDCVLDDAVIEWCDLRGASFARVSTLDLCTTRRTTFRDCDLRGADFTKRRFEDTTFVRCKLAGVKGKPAIEGPYRVEQPDFSEVGDGSDVRSAEAVYALWARR
jgi:uncharacterized protein YjbI with pentapeptide repeats